jgi:hypothetical protein
MEPPRPDGDATTVTIAVLTTTLEAEQARGYLEANGIAAVVFHPDGEALDPLMGYTLGLVHLRVAPGDAAAATALLEAARPPAAAADGDEPPDDGTVACMACGVAMPEYLDRCPACGWTFS